MKHLAFLAFLVVAVEAVMSLSGQHWPDPVKPAPDVIGSLSKPHELDPLGEPFGQVRVWQQSCTSTAAAIKPSSAPTTYSSLRIMNNNSGAVYIGGSDVNTSTKGYPLCTTAATCPEFALSLPALAGVPYCVAGSATTITVIAGN